MAIATPVRSDTQAEALADLENEIRMCERSGDWTGAEAAPITAQTCVTAASVARTLAVTPGIGIPRVSASPFGAVMLTWAFPTGFFSLLVKQQPDRMTYQWEGSDFSSQSGQVGLDGAIQKLRAVKA